MAFDAFIQIPGVDGESTRKGFEKQIPIQSFSVGASNPTTIGSGGGGGAGKVSLSGFTFMKKTDTASPVLFQNCCTGTHYPKATVTLNKSGNNPVAFLKYEFESVFVESIAWSGVSGGDDTPTESVTIAFGKVTITYMAQTDTGAPGAVKTGMWDLRTVAAA